MPSLYTHIDSNKRKTWLLMSVFFVVVMLVGFVFSQAMETPVILYFAVAFSLVSSFVSYWWSDKIVLSMSNAKPVTFENNRELYRLVENLCITAGLPIPKIYIIHDASPNAFATGRDPEHAAIAMTTGLLDKLDKSELEGVIAHELSHIGNRDILIATIATVMVGIIVLLADWFMRWSIFGGRSSRSSGKESGQAQLIITIAAIVLAILAPLFAYMLQFAISRKREFLADADAAMLTRYPEGLARALEKIAGDPKPMDNASKATAHLYISSPFKNDRRGAKKPGFFAKALMTHPPVEERIAALRGQNI
ncbi:MAG: M48 family metallopeptidase [Patescibacteria group bacterium]|nr:MAG: M48 family metallopeptidase [Patescibacteria group bacterium]